MSLMKTGLTALALIMSLGLITAPGVFAKAHDSGVSDTDSPPGMGGRESPDGRPPGASTSDNAPEGGPGMGDAISGAVDGNRGFSDGKGSVSEGAGNSGAASGSDGRGQ